MTRQGEGQKHGHTVPWSVKPVPDSCVYNGHLAAPACGADPRGNIAVCGSEEKGTRSYVQKLRRSNTLFLSNTDKIQNSLIYRRKKIQRTTNLSLIHI